jgi:hypothetical protein
MKNIGTYIQIASLTAIIFLVIRLGSISDDRDRNHNNMISLLNGVNSIILKNNEMSDYLKDNNPELLKRMTDSLAMKIRINNVSKYNETSYIYKDTNIIEVPIQYMESRYAFAYKDSCWGIKGYYDAFDEKLIIQEREAANSIIVVDYVKREKVAKWFFGGIRIGKKKAGVYIESKCGEAKRMEIMVND